MASGQARTTGGGTPPPLERRHHVTVAKAESSLFWRRTPPGTTSGRSKLSKICQSWQSCRDHGKTNLRICQGFGAPCTTRTCDLLVRSQTLYPTELRARRGLTDLPPAGLGPWSRNRDYTSPRRAATTRAAARELHHLALAALAGARSRPVPTAATPGSAMGRRPPIAASPVIARTADISARS
jgi:hypothetical protein